MSKNKKDAFTKAVKRLNEYRKKDPDFKKALEALVEFEAGMSGKDPFEGSVVKKPKTPGK